MVSIWGQGQSCAFGLSTLSPWVHVMKSTHLTNLAAKRKLWAPKQGKCMKYVLVCGMCILWCTRDQTRRIPSRQELFVSSAGEIIKWGIFCYRVYQTSQHPWHTSLPFRAPQGSFYPSANVTDVLLEVSGSNTAFLPSLWATLAPFYHQNDYTWICLTLTH